MTSNHTQSTLPKPTIPSIKENDWRKHIPSKRSGAYYFLDSQPQTWSSSGYFTFRGATYQIRDRLVAELANWIRDFKNSGSKLLVSKGQQLKNEDTGPYWRELEMDEERREIDRINMKRRLTIRKENLKQHDYFSRLMTTELQDFEPLPRARSPMEEAEKRKRHKAGMTEGLTTQPSPTDAEDSDDSCRPPSEPSSQDISPQRPMRRWIYIYPQGQGQLRYPSNFQRPRIIGGHDVASILWSLRDTIVSKLPNATDFEDELSVDELDHPHEFLTLNHIYLIQKDDVSSSIFAALGDTLWQDLQSPPLEHLLDPKTVMGLFDIAVRLATLGYQDGRKMAGSWRAIGMVMMLSVSALWDTNRAKDNEATDTKKRNDPFLEAYCTHLPNTYAQWDTVFPPSEARRMDSSNKRGTRPDYFSKVVDRGRIYYPLVVEIKKAKQGEATLLTDLEKMGLQMKDSLDAMAKARTDLQGVKVYGYTIVENELSLYSMAIESPGVYVMREISKAYLPRHHADMGVLPTTINLFANLAKYLNESAVLCGRPLLKEEYGGTTKTLRSPLKRPRTGW
ncbi:hypothetical protein BGZ94_004049 [Podila epigama]|nr:hypothetical protein BGZ94_004049 [Podila epigama]